jgi:hypothetical protein
LGMDKWINDSVDFVGASYREGRMPFAPTLGTIRYINYQLLTINYQLNKDHWFIL